MHTAFNNTIFTKPILCCVLGLFSVSSTHAGQRVENGCFEVWEGSSLVGWQMKNVERLEVKDGEDPTLKLHEGGELSQEIRLEPGSYLLSFKYRVYGGDIRWQIRGAKGEGLSGRYATPYWHTQPLHVVVPVTIRSVESETATLIFRGGGSEGRCSVLSSVSFAPVNGGYTGVVVSETEVPLQANAIFGIHNPHALPHVYTYSIRILNYYMEELFSEKGTVKLEPNRHWTQQIPFATGASIRYRAEIVFEDESAQRQEKVAFLNSNDLGHYRRSFRLPDDGWAMQIRPRNAPEIDSGEPRATREFPRGIRPPKTDDPFNPDSYYWGVYERSVEFPKWNEHERILLEIPRAPLSPKAYIDDTPVGETLGMLSLKADVSNIAKPGSRHRITVRSATEKAVWKHEGSGENHTLTRMLPTGAIRDVGVENWLHVVPDIRIDDVAVETSWREKKISLIYTLVNERQHSEVVRISPRILDNGMEKLRFPEAKALVRSGGAIRVQVEAPWEDPVLWMPRAPHLYRLQTALFIGKTQQDEHNLRFGFREVWTEGKKILWNGRDLKLLTRLSFPHPAHAMMPINPDTEWRALRQYTDNGIWFSRTFGGFSSGLMDMLDEIGFVSRHSFHLNLAFADWRKVARNDDEYWSMMARHVRESIIENRNHPSIMLWSMENETFLCGLGDQQPWSIERYSELRQVARGVKPGILLEHDGSEPSGDADVINLHYPFNAARTMPYLDAYPPRLFEKDEHYLLQLYPGSLLWDEKKPLALGEDFIGFAETPQTLSLLSDEHIYQIRGDNPRAGVNHDAFEMAYHRLHEPIMREARRRGLAYFTTWPLADPGCLDTLQPQAIFVEEPWRNLRSGETFELTLRVHHDLLHNLTAPLRWRFENEDGTVLDRGSIKLTMSPGETLTRTIRLHAPKTTCKTQATLYAELEDSVAGITKRVVSFRVYPDRKISSRSMVLYDPQGDTSGAFKKIGIAFESGEVPQDGKLFIIGRDALIGVKSYAHAEAVVEFARNGGQVIVMEQRGRVPEWLPVRLAPNVGFHAFAAFPRTSGHPAVAGLDVEDFSFWRGPGSRVATYPYWKPRSSNFFSILDTGTIGGFLGTVLAELPLGRGSMVFCQLDITENLGVDPVASHLLSNLLQNSAITTRKALGEISVEGGAAIADAARRAGLHVSDSSDSEVLLVDARGIDAERIGELLKQAQEGRTLWLCGLSPETAPLWENAGLQGLAVESATAFHAYKLGDDPLLAGLSNTDLYWMGMRLAPLPGEYRADGLANLVDVRCSPPNLPGAKALVSRGALIRIPFGKGLVLLDQINWHKAMELVRFKASRIPALLATQLGVKVDAVGEDIPAPKFAEGMTYEPLDLVPAYNEMLNDVLKDHNGVFGDIPFDIRSGKPGAVLLGSRKLTQPTPRLTSLTPPLPVSNRYDAVYFLMTAYDPYEGGEGYGSGDVYGGIEFKLADDSIHALPLMHKVHAANLFEPMGDLAVGKLVWQGPTPFAAWWDLYTRWPGNRWIQREHPNRLYLVRWINPKPDISIDSIRFYSTDTHVVPVILGMTGAKK